ncbi:Ser/Thr protein phosphatase, putative [Trichomonas vaginalis G3]|uniref:Serine/threonine-protein phosphatase n=1 Tax=Trichomonas vaginalis (strain ATCC PRA-98 / G3) TaxID=412133 RepID=A2DPE5_TRIV3|nr:phosphoprotein phosphatase protein [Trichomonas vaginalis G3]EAY17689.1 Ser/Thr protein phosphatase, putative [Trichomonas vaginalis G3]KAI5507907.1 phosphoprotein phosphatase protein [Trichomonas vaginalis G3]|eukprot:XP_001329824.1 Ser/Thr protein phosphatase [Trichomonas vaginalis G3]
MIANYVLCAYQPLIASSSPRNSSNIPMDIPKLKYEDLLSLIAITQNFLQSEPTLYRLNDNFLIVGDLHGNLRDLLRIFAAHGLPPNRKYIFLGDYVDRGEFSIEVITLLFTLKLLYPDHVYLIRGNHEFSDINAVYGFKNQVLAEYDENIYNQFNEAFSYLPLACVLNDCYFLVHGGISPLLKSVDEIESVKRPINSLYDPIVYRSFIPDILWSDPGEAELMYFKNYRGFGNYFGAVAVMNFLRENNIKRIIRSHQCVNAVEQHHGGTVVTVFSTSNYSKKSKNSSGILEVNG